MIKLIFDLNFDVFDDFYVWFIVIYDGLDDDESVVLNVCLIFILVNYIGDMDVLEQVFEVVKFLLVQF